ncbi:DUF58 domain-containing protein [Phycicoccus sp. CSK15P-2]|uniref:DUF58 domain-containing protein n=1 Tax=Phycicoccus sp. CSK15P-2 TaxID=2807627 RepID=UPI00194FB9B1|nr:DUF58 domain-containing protein [Phycicoccus sp. CSK15P-2]MBM6403531.1 DUF58 domain-containing protein [Phycicoccus sp. CSK15P-2]
MSDPSRLPDDADSTVRRSDLTPPPAARGADAPARPDDGVASEEQRGRASVGRGPARTRDAAAGKRRLRVRLPRIGRPGRGGTSRTMPVGGSGTGSRGGAAAGNTRTITLPRVQVPSAITDTGARILVLTGDRIRPLAQQTRPVWHPVLEVLRWVSPLGWTVLGVGLVSWWLAARFTWAELAMVAAGCLVLVLACVVLAVGRARLTIRADVEPSRVTVGDPATGRVVATNVSRRVLLPLLLELPIGRTAARFTLPTLAAGRAHEELFVVPTHQRGVVPVGPATTVHGDPFGLVRRTVAWTERTELVVHPRTVSLESLGAGLLRDLEGEVTPDLSMSDLAFHALREYQAGDDRRYVHWRSSAKHGRLLVRQFLDTRRSHLAVVVDTSTEVYTRAEEDVELGISCAASLAVRSILDEQDTTVVCNGETASRTTAPLTLDALARAVVAPLDLYASVGEAAALAPDASVAVLVTGVERPFIQVQRVLDQFEPEVVRVALVVDPEVQVGVRRLGSIVILHVRELADLRRVLFAGALT